MLIFLESDPNVTNLKLQGKKHGLEGKAVPVICNSH
jgi:hypothetical protein